MIFFRPFCCVSVPHFEPKILIKGVHLTNLKTKVEQKVDFFSYEESYTYYESNKAKISICHLTAFYSIFNMSSCRKTETQNALPKFK